MPKLDRRSFLSATAGLTAMVAVSSARADWSPQFDTSNVDLADRNYGAPLLSGETLEATRRAAALYDSFAEQGGWPAHPWAGRLSLGMRHPDVAVLRQRLAFTGDLERDLGLSNTYDSYVAAAVRRYQARNGLAIDGVAGAGTLESLNVPAATRANQLSANISRIADELTSETRYVTINVPAAEIDMVEGDRIVLKQSAVVGQPDRATPLLTSAIHEVNFNPYWTAPKSIIRKDIIPVVRRDPGYLDRMGMHIFDGNWNEVDPASIDWSTDEAEQYFFRQDPGAKNALGRVRINFANNYAVYLHDTPKPGLFGDASRFHSSGCVRVQRIPEFVTWLLKETEGWDAARVSEFLQNGERRDVKLSHPVPVHFVYITAWGEPHGEANFRPDVYDLIG